MRRVALGIAVLTACVATAGGASAADLPYRRHAPPRDHIVYAPRGSAPVIAYAPPYRVIYQVPSDECARNDFCPAVL